MSTFSRNDQTCSGSGNGGTGKICPLDAHPFTTGIHDSGRSASRGDSQARAIVLGADGKTPTPKKLDRQAPGKRALLAVVDTATGKTATATTTALEVTPASPVAAGTTKMLTATVAPSAAGSVQFTEGTANIGSAVAISGGTTTFTTTFTTTLPSGTHSLTAVFTPANPGAFGPSTSSPVSLTVQPLLSWLR